MSSVVNGPSYPLLDHIEVPEAEIENWQGTADLLAEIAGVPAALIMRVHPHEIEVFVSSRSPGNVYHQGEKAPLETGLYCETVMSTRRKLVVPNALKDPVWDHNPDIELEMISYCGLPIAWPSGELFGTICILDTKENAYHQRTHDLMERFRTLIQASLANIHASSHVRIQRDEAESALHEQETDFSLMVEAVQDYAVIMLDPAGRVLRWNAGAERIKGYRPEEIVGRHFSLFYPPEDVESGKPERELKVAAAEGRFEDEGWRVRKDGSRFFASICMTALRHESGQLRGFGKITRDITERKQAEENLRANRAILQEILDSVPQAVFRKDRDSVYLGCNQQFARAAGLTDPAQVVGKTDFDLPWPREEAETYRSDDAQVVGSGKAKRHIVERLLRADGTPTWVDTTKIPLFDGGGQVQGILGVFDDITERRQAEEALRESEKQYRLLVESTFEAIVVIQDGLIEQFNPAGMTMTGYSADEIISTPFPLFVHPEDRAEIVDNYQRRMQGESLPSVLEFRLLNKDGSFRWVLANTVVNVQWKGRPASLHTLVDITERQRAEAALRESELKFRSLFETAEGAILLFADDRWVDCNARALSIFGCTREQIIGAHPRRFSPLMQPDGRPSEEEAIRKIKLAFAVGPQVFEWEHCRGDGTRFAAEVSLNRLELQGKPHIQAIVRDIGDRKRAEAEIERLQRLYAAIIEVNGTIIRVQTPGELFREVCRSLVERAGLRMAWIGLLDVASPRVLVVASHGDDTDYLSGLRVYVDERPEGMGATGTAIREGKPVVCNDFMNDLRTFPWRDAASRAGWQASAAFPFRLAGEARGALTVYAFEVNFFGDREVTLLDQAATDISYALENLENEGSLRERERELREAQAIAGFGSYALDVGSGQWRSSENLDAILGIGPGWERSVAELRGLIHPEEREAMTSYVREEVIGRRTSFDRQCRIVRPSDGELRWVDCKGELSFGPDGTVTLLKGTIADVTDRKEAAERIDQLNADLERRVEERTAALEAANRELDAFSHSVSHDLRAPLRAIEGFSEILVKDSSDHLTDEDQRLLDVVRRNARKMSVLIGDLLTFSRSARTGVRHTRLDMREIVRSAFDEVAGDPETRRKIDFRLGELPNAEGDAPLLRQVWINLLSNAVKYSSRADKPVVEVTGEMEGDSGVYRVRDNGAGFDMAHADKLFGVFQRLHGGTEFEGTGIGLALVKQIVTRHGGRVWADGVVGKGATFTFSLPGRAGAPRAGGA